MFEGFYSMSKAILQHFCNGRSILLIITLTQVIVADKNIFEFFDYIFGFIQKLSQVMLLVFVYFKVTHIYT